jgi:hypothetical protein
MGKGWSDESVYQGPSRTTLLSSFGHPLVLMAKRGTPSNLSNPTRAGKRKIEGTESKRLQTGSQGLPPFTSFYFFLTLFSLVENVAPIRRSDRPNIGQGGALQQLEATSEAVQSTKAFKKAKTQVQNIPDNIPTNPMAPAPKKPIRRYGKADASVRFTIFSVLLRC